MTACITAHQTHLRLVVGRPRRRREMSGSEAMTARGGYELDREVEMAAENVEQQEEEADIFQLISYPRLRLRWTAELHDEFVKAVDQLGGANLATPKEIKNVMRIPGLTLCHLKSHLQKYRVGKMGRKLWRRYQFVPTYKYRPRARGARVPPVNLEAGRRRPSNISNVFGAINGSYALGAEMTYGNMHRPVEPQAAVENLDSAAKFSGLNANYQHVGSSSTSAVNMEEQFASDRPSLLPLFPPISDWADLVNLQGGGRVVAPPPPRPASVDGYLKSLGYSSSEFGHTQGHQYPYGGGTVNYRTFFDEVASFSKVDDTAHLTSMGAHDLSAEFANFYDP